MGLVGYKRPEYARFAIKKNYYWCLSRLVAKIAKYANGPFQKKSKGTFEAAKSSYYFQNFIETEPTNKATPRSSGAAAGSLWLVVSTGIQLPAGLGVRSPALDGSAVTPHGSLRDLRLL